MKRRRCLECGVSLADEDVMKIKSEDGSWAVLPLPLCPACFTQQLKERASKNLERSEKS